MARLARLILATTQSSMMVFVVTMVATWLNLGLGPDFVQSWLKAFIIAWPIAAGMAYLVTPMARRFTDHVMKRFEGNA
jgi:short subunit fatty acids transporter